MLVPRAEEGRPEPVAILRAAGAIVDDVVAYRTLPVAADDPLIQPGLALLAGGAAAAVCALFAPSQVTALAAMLAGARRRAARAVAATTRLAAIGETTAAALRAAGVRDVAVASAPTPEGIANAVAAVYPSKP